MFLPRAMGILFIGNFIVKQWLRWDHFNRSVWHVIRGGPLFRRRILQELPAMCSVRMDVSGLHLVVKNFAKWIWNYRKSWISLLRPLRMVILDFFGNLLARVCHANRCAYLREYNVHFLYCVLWVSKQWIQLHSQINRRSFVNDVKTLNPYFNCGHMKTELYINA